MYNKNQGNGKPRNNKGYSNNKKYSNNGRDNYNKNAKGGGKKPFAKKEFNGYQNRLRLKKVEPSTYCEEVLKTLFNAATVTPEEVKYFRRSIVENHHLYKIMVSCENHFASGYQYMTVGWCFATNNYANDAVNINIYIDDEFLKQVHSDIKGIIESKTLEAISQILLLSGKPVRYLMNSAEYETQKKYMPKSWVVDKNQTWPNFSGNDIYSEIALKVSGHIVLRNNFSNTNIKLGNRLDDILADYLKKTFKIPAIRSIPFSGIVLYDDIDRRYKRAVIQKCDKDNKIHFRSKKDDSKFITNVILNAVEFEQRAHRHKYNKRYDVIYDGEILEDKATK